VNRPPARLQPRRRLPPRRVGAKLGVFLSELRLGTLERRGPSRYRFTYSQEALASGTASLSVSLPLREATFAPSESAPFFEGLLPEGVVRAVVAEKLRLSEGDGFALLQALGADCAGAVSVLPEGQHPGPLPPHKPRPLAENELAAMLRDLPRDPLGIDSEPDGVRLSLGGVQDKLVLIRLPSGRFALPRRGDPSTCLLKPEHGRYEGLAVNEAFCMAVAATAGSDVAKTELIAVEDTRCLYVERFDRASGAEGRIFRLHQEDMCQALGVLPTAKYEANGGPSVPDVVGLLRGLGSRRAALDVNAFVKAVLTSFLLGNSDAHGKNFALLYDPAAGVRLAPLYDVVSTVVYPDLTQRMAMAIGGEEDPREVDLGSWERLGADSGLGGSLSKIVRRWSADVLAGAEACRRRAVDEGWHHPVIDAVVEICQERAARLIDAR
jgi:serine/threonine-protein kinase HipA